MLKLSVVSYRNSTSNHNKDEVPSFFVYVVSYRNSTSNHNKLDTPLSITEVVSYRNSTSNHNSGVGVNATMSLYLIEILHQTTTRLFRRKDSISCILSKFYIKPQLARQWLMVPCVVSYRNSTSNHNLPSTI